MSVVLDTNALIWLLEGNSRLGPQATHQIEETFRSSRVLVSAATFWEIAVLLAKQRIASKRPIEQWRADTLGLGVGEIAIDGDLAIESVALTGLHPDPADRFIVATAMKVRAPLVTSDARLLAWQGPLACIDARV